jgi:outer membrane protein assembly factor BamB
LVRTLVALFAIAVCATVAPSAATAAIANQAVTYQLNAAHDGHQTDNHLTTPLSQAWSVTFPNKVSYPLIVNGVVYVTVASAGSYGTTLYALNQATGATLWSRGLGGTYWWSALAYDADKVFTINYDGILSAYDAATGASKWTVDLPGQYAFSSAPTAINGMVYLGGAGSGGTMYAVSQATGQVVWTAPVANGDNSSPAVDSNRVYVTYACHSDYAFDPLSGSQLWHYSTGCSGGGGKTPVVAAGFVFSRDSANGVLLNAASGTIAGSFNASTAPAVGNGKAYMVSGGTLTAVNESGAGTNAWTFAGDSKLNTAPLLIGDLLFEGSSTGNLYAINPNDGSTVWTGNVGTSIDRPDEQNVSQPLTGLAAGQGTLIVPAGSKLVAYVGANAGTGVPVNSGPPTVTGPPVVGRAVGADTGIWNPLPSGFGYQWLKCDPAGSGCSAIAGATSQAYTPDASDSGATLRVSVTATNGSGTSAAVTSAPSTPVTAGPPTGNKTATTLTLTPSKRTPTVGERVAFTARLSPQVDAGTITFTSRGTDIPGCDPKPAANAGDSVVCIAEAANPGKLFVTASYSGSESFSESSATQIIIVGPKSTTVPTPWEWPTPWSAPTPGEPPTPQAAAKPEVRLEYYPFARYFRARDRYQYGIAAARVACRNGATHFRVRAGGRARTLSCPAARRRRFTPAVMGLKARRTYRVKTTPLQMKGRMVLKRGVASLIRLRIPSPRSAGWKKVKRASAMRGPGARTVSPSERPTAG